jgi:hypothetical protein
MTDIVAAVAVIAEKRFKRMRRMMANIRIKAAGRRGVYIIPHNIAAPARRSFRSRWLEAVIAHVPQVKLA